MKRLLLISAAVCIFCVSAQAQTTAFNFQGRLNDGNNPANGRYDLQFKLFDAIAGGNQVGATVDRPNLLLINGVFSTTLDFGSAAFSGGDRFIEISLRPSVPANVTPNAFIILGARQQIMSVPYSVKSLNATNADNATNAVNSTNATNAANATNAQTAVNSQQLGGVAASQFVQKGGVGTVKAMVYVDGDNVNNISQCYNATLSGSAATTPPCGFTLNHFTDGGWGINFGFPLGSSFMSLTTSYFRGRQVAENDYNNAGIYWRPSTQPNTIDVRTYESGDVIATKDSKGSRRQSPARKNHLKPHGRDLCIYTVTSTIHFQLKSKA
jgi:hypothetical protein